MHEIKSTPLHVSEALKLPERERFTADVKVSAFSVTPYEFWAVDKIYTNLLNIAEAAFSDVREVGNVNRCLPKELSCRSRVYVLRAGEGDIVGFSTVRPARPGAKEAHITLTAISPEYQRRGLVGQLMQEVERDLLKRCYTSMVREARTDNGWADTLKRHYGPRVIDEFSCDSDNGPPRVGLKISLPNSE